MVAGDTNPSNESKPLRSRLPSPGCLLVCTLVVILASFCFGIGWRAHRQQARLEHFEQLDAHIVTEPASPVWLHDLVVATLGEEHAGGFTDVTRLGLDSTQVTDADLPYLSGFAKLQDLDLMGTRITDAGLQHPSGLTSLHYLSLTGTPVTDRGLHHLSGLTSLTWLSLSDTQVADAGVEQLRSQLPQLENIR